MRLKGLGQLKNNDVIGNRTRDLPTCSIVPQPTTLQRAPEGVMNETNARKWCRMFNEGRTHVHDEERSEHSTFTTEDL
jgi:hypothetical protein